MGEDPGTNRMSGDDRHYYSEQELGVQGTRMEPVLGLRWSGGRRSP